MFSLLAACFFGWLLAGRWESSAAGRAALAGCFGLAFGTALGYGASLLFSPHLADGAVFIVCMGGAWWLHRSPRGSQAVSPAFPWPVRCLIGLLAVSAWMFAVGEVQLQGWGVVRETAGLEAFSGGNFLALQGLTAAIQLFMVFGTFALFRLVFPGKPLCYTLAAVFALAADSRGWLVYEEPGDILLHLWTLLTLAFILLPARAERVWALPPWTGILATQWPLALGLVASSRRWSDRATLLLGMAGGLATLVLIGPSWGLTAAALLVLLNRKESLRQETTTLALLALLSGQADLFGLTAAAVEAADRLERLWRKAEPVSVTLDKEWLGVPSRGVIIAAVLCLLWLGIDGGETRLNDGVLIAAQKRDVDVLTLFLPKTESAWKATFDPSPASSAPTPVLLASVRPGQERSAGAGSLVRLELELHNTGRTEISLSDFPGVRLKPGFGARTPLKPIEQPLAPLSPKKISPGGSAPIDAFLRTSDTPLQYRLAVVLVGTDGSEVVVPLREQFTLTTWPVFPILDTPFGGHQ